MAAEPGCEWLTEQAADKLELPEFPTWNHEFAVPPIPRLVPTWERLQTLAAPTRYSVYKPPAQMVAQHEGSNLEMSGKANLMQAVASGATLGAGLSALIVTTVVVMRRARESAYGKR
jgi:hypothetical protein|tara:strand:- start:501 stop:851 length:351 start_codon:yes stop_codon:yes gene_type:complete